MMNMDETDQKILFELMKDAKVTSKELAAKLDIHSNTALQRMKRLENEGIILGYTAKVDFGKIGYELSAAILINIETSRGWGGELRAALSIIPEVESIYVLTGHYDLLVTIRLKDKRNLVEILRRIQDIPRVRNTNTMLVLENGLSDRI